jgi:hypothetical protein
MPLGDAYRGQCYADPAREWTPDAEILVGFCNMGYARSRCPRFPLDEGPDALRFAVSADDGERLSIRYAAERNYEPHSSGSVECRAADLRLSEPVPSPLSRQIAAFAESYLRRKAAHDG